MYWCSILYIGHYKRINITYLKFSSWPMRPKAGRWTYCNGWPYLIIIWYRVFWHFWKLRKNTAWVSKKLQITKRKLLNLSETRQHINGKQENLFVPFRIENRKELARSLTRLFFEFRVYMIFIILTHFAHFCRCSVIF